MSLIAALSYIIFWLINGMIKKMLFKNQFKTIKFLQGIKVPVFVLCVIFGIVSDTLIPFCTPTWIEFTLLTPPVIIVYGILRIYDYLKNRTYREKSR